MALISIDIDPDFGTYFHSQRHWSSLTYALIPWSKITLICSHRNNSLVHEYHYKCSCQSQQYTLLGLSRGKNLSKVMEQSWSVWSSARKGLLQVESSLRDEVSCIAICHGQPWRACDPVRCFMLVGACTCKFNQRQYYSTEMLMHDHPLTSAAHSVLCPIPTFEGGCWGCVSDMMYISRTP